MTPEMKISDWRAINKNTLKGTFTITLVSGLIIHDMCYFVMNEKQWVNFPSREYHDQRGEKRYIPFIDFVNTPTRDRFKEQCLAALHKHLHEEEIEA